MLWLCGRNLGVAGCPSVIWLIYWKWMAALFWLPARLFRLKSLNGGYSLCRLYHSVSSGWYQYGYYPDINDCRGFFGCVTSLRLTANSISRMTVVIAIGSNHSGKCIILIVTGIIVSLCCDTVAHSSILYSYSLPFCDTFLYSLS